MNFIALGFALPAALHNPWLHGAALVVLLVCLPRLLGIVIFRTPRLASLRKSGAAKVRCARARSLPVMVSRVSGPLLTWRYSLRIISVAIPHP